MVPQLYSALLVILLSLHLDAAEAECECGKNNLDTHIVGGNESQVHEWPWQVYISTKLNAREWYKCGGSLISPSWVLTAAHCVKQALDIIIKIGEHETYSVSDKPHTKTRRISQIIIHSGYEDDLQSSFKVINDIAVIKLKRPVEYSHAIRPVCLPTNLHTQLFDGENGTISGWGRTYHNKDVSNVLLDVTLPIISNKECENMYYKRGFRIRDDQVCTYEDGKSACNGDSGGPLVWLDDSGHYQQIGIASFTTRCAWEYSPGIYTRVTSYIDWIEEKTNTHFCSS